MPSSIFADKGKVEFQVARYPWQHASRTAASKREETLTFFIAHPPEDAQQNKTTYTWYMVTEKVVRSKQRIPAVVFVNDTQQNGYMGMFRRVYALAYPGTKPYCFGHTSYSDRCPGTKSGRSDHT